jgi:SET domain-containing protein 6
MRSIQPIARGEQIYNTYGDLPNADLLRRYGYVISGLRDDVVEVSAELIIKTISRHPETEVRRRIEILDEEDIFDEYGSFIRY